MGLPQIPAHLLHQQGHGQKLPSTSRFPARAVSPLKTQIHRTPWKKPQHQAWLCLGIARVPDHPAHLKKPTRSFTWRTTTLKVLLKQMPSNQFLQFLSSCISLDRRLDETSHAQRGDAGTSYPTLSPRIFGSLSLALSLTWISSNSISSSQGSFTIYQMCSNPPIKCLYPYQCQPSLRQWGGFHIRSCVRCIPGECRPVRCSCH